MSQQPPGGNEPPPPSGGMPPPPPPGYGPPGGGPPPPPGYGPPTPPPPDYGPPPPPPPDYGPPPPAPGGFVPPPPGAYTPPPPGSYQPPPPGFGMPGGGAIAGMAPATDQMAIWSLVCAIVGFLGLCCAGVGGLVLGPVAFFLGNSSLERIRSSGGTIGGESLAQIGRVFGIVVAVIGLLVLISLIGYSVTNHTTSTPFGP